MVKPELKTRLVLICSLFYKYVISWLFSALKDLLPLEWLYLKGQLELNPVPSVLVLYVL